MGTLQQLYQLQELDLERDKLRQQLKHILAQLGESEALRAARARLEQLQAELAGWRAQRRALELETQSVEDKIAAAEERLYGGRVSNPKELTDLQNEVASLRKRRASLDEKSLEVMLAIEEHEAELAEMQAELSALQASWDERQHSLGQERQASEARLAELDQARGEQARGIPAHELGVYESLRQSKNNVAIAMIEDGFCSVCGVEVPERTLAQVIQSDALVFCANCDRILLE